MNHEVDFGGQRWGSENSYWIQKTENGDATEDSPDTSKEESKSQMDSEDGENMTIQRELADTV